LRSPQDVARCLKDVLWVECKTVAGEVSQCYAMRRALVFALSTKDVDSSGKFLEEQYYEDYVPELFGKPCALNAEGLSANKAEARFVWHRIGCGQCADAASAEAACTEGSLLLGASSLVP